MREILLLESEELDQIHRTSLRILAETGMVIGHEQALMLLQKHGAHVDWQGQRAWLPERLVAEALATAPATFTVAGSDPAHDVTLALNGRVHARPLVGPDFVVDPGALRHRPATLRDVEDWIRLVDRLPNLHVNCGPYPSDEPEEIRDLVTVERTFELSHKPVLISHYSAARLRWSLELAAMLPDRGLPRLMVYVSCNSPLYFTGAQVEILMVAATRQVSIVINSAAVAGATAPYTLAGIAAQMNAEMLAGVVLAQLAGPSAAILWSPLPLILDMRSTAASYGYAEIGLLQAIFVQLGKFYRLPTQCTGLATDAVIPDVQAGFERILVSYAPLLTRPSIVGGAGGLSAYMVASVEQLILDNDIRGGLFRTLDGVRVDEDSLAWEAVARVGPRGEFLSDPHTLAFLRREYYYSQMANRLGAEAWAAAESPDLRARAAERVGSLLAGPVQPVVPEVTVREMRRLVQQARIELAQEKTNGRG